MNSQDEIADYFKNKRDQYAVEIRKGKKNQMIAAKRAKLAAGLTNGDNTFNTNYSNSQILDIFNQLAGSFLEAFKIGDFIQLTQVVEQIRRILCSNPNPPIKELTATGIVPQILQLLEPAFDKYEDLLVECAWCITNIASGDNSCVEYLVSLDAVPKLLALFEHPNDDIKENVIWALANIAGDSLEPRNYLLNNGISRKIDRVLSKKTYETPFIANIMWLVSNLCMGPPYPEYCLLSPFLLLLQTYILESKEKEVLTHCLWALSYLSDGDKDQIENILEMEIIERILELLEDDDPKITKIILKIIGNLLTGEDDQIQYLINRGIVPALAPLLSHPRKQLRKEASWVFSNILACNYHQIEEVVNYKDGLVVNKIMKMVKEEGQGVAQECIFCLANICSGGTFEHIQMLVKEGLIEIIVKGIQDYTDVEVIKACLEALENVLDEAHSHYSLYEDSQNPYLTKVEQCNGFQVLEGLQRHPDEGVYKIITRIIQKHLDHYEC